MPDPEIRTITADDVAALLHSLRVTFLEAQDPPQAAVDFIATQVWEPHRTWGAFDRGRAVATLRTIPRRLTVPGPDGGTLDLDADGLTSVTVAATHRRRGLLRQMITRSLDAAVQRGDAVSILVAAEWPIYGRFGYAPAVWRDAVTIDRSFPGARLLADDRPGELRELTVEECLTELPAVFELARRRRAGQIDRPDTYWRRQLDPELQHTGRGPRPVVIGHVGPDGLDGAVAWTPHGSIDFATPARIEVLDHLAADETADRALWGYLLGMDLVGRIEAHNRPVDEPLPHWLADGRAAAHAPMDFMWLRVLDVPKALSARRYATPGTLVLDVIDDDLGGFAGGRYALDAGPDGAACRPAPGATPDLELHQRALAGCYLGGQSFAVARSAGLVQERSTGALARAEAMFRTPLAPWLATSF